MKNKQKKEFTPIYVALDTDALRMLSEMHKGISEGTIKPESMFTVDHLRTYPLYKLICEGKIKPIVTRTVIKECPDKDVYISFMNKFCYTPEIKEEDYDDYRLKVFNLAQKYCTFNSSNWSPFKGYIDEDGKLVPTSDAINMAEACILKVCIITNNAKHFVFDEKDIEHAKKKKEKGRIKADIYRLQKYWKRARGVFSINALEGYGAVNELRFAYPKPFPLYFIQEMVDKYMLDDLRVCDNPAVKPFGEEEKFLDNSENETEDSV